MRVFSLVAGAAAIGVAGFRYVRSLDGIRNMSAELGNPEGALAAIVWHSLTYVMAVLGVALLLSVRASRETALSVGLLATAIFGGIAAIMATYSAAALGDPFAFYPVFLLAGLAALSGVAAAKA